MEENNNHSNHSDSTIKLLALEKRRHISCQSFPLNSEFNIVFHLVYLLLFSFIKIQSLTILCTEEWQTVRKWKPQLHNHQEQQLQCLMYLELNSLLEK